MQKTNWFKIIVELKNNGISGREIARRLKVSPTTILLWKNGSNPDYDTGKKLIEMWEAETQNKL